MAAERQSLSAEVMALARSADGTAGSLRWKLRRIFGLNRAYRRLFFDKDGNLTPDARTVLRDLIEASGFGTASREIDNGTLQVREGGHRVVLHIFGRFRLPDGRIDQLERDLRQTEDDDE